MTFVKICGIRRAEDAAAAVEAGADALGFNFWKGSSRYVDPREAARMVAAVPEGIWKVGVFVDELAERAVKIAQKTGLTAIQLHGSEPPEYLSGLGSFQKIKAFKVGDRFAPEQLRSYAAADVFLLDGFVPGRHGGTGQSFDWSQAVRAKAYGRILLAGGLSAANVREALAQVDPWGVDVCSGVETEPGIKSARRIREFVAVVRSAEAERAGEGNRKEPAAGRHGIK